MLKENLPSYAARTSASSSSVISTPETEMYLCTLGEADTEASVKGLEMSNDVTAWP